MPNNSEDCRPRRLPAGKISAAETAAAVAAQWPRPAPPARPTWARLMAVLKPRLAVKADMAEVSKLVKAALAG